MPNIFFVGVVVPPKMKLSELIVVPGIAQGSDSLTSDLGALRFTTTASLECSGLPASFALACTIAPLMSLQGLLHRLIYKGPRP